jgi:hypothetical protein
MHRLKQSGFCIMKLKKILKFTQNPAKYISNSRKIRMKAKKSSLLGCFFGLQLAVGSYK